MLNIHPQVGAIAVPTTAAADRVFWFRGLDHVDFHLQLENRTENGEPFTHLHLFAHTDNGALSHVSHLPLSQNCGALLDTLFDQPPPEFVKHVIEPFLERVARRINSGPIVALAAP